jgi:hypothetical protein
VARKHTVGRVVLISAVALASGFHE